MPLAALDKNNFDRAIAYKTIVRLVCLPAKSLYSLRFVFFLDFFEMSAGNKHNVD